MRAFFGCESISEITFPDGIEEIPAECCSECRKLKKVIIESEYFPVRICNSAFNCCNSLEEFVLSHVVYEENERKFNSKKEYKGVKFRSPKNELYSEE